MQAADAGWWERLEGRSAAADAPHWIRVYDELITSFRMIHADAGDDPATRDLVARRLRECQWRRAYWLGVDENNSPVT